MTDGSNPPVVRQRSAKWGAFLTVAYLALMSVYGFAVRGSFLEMSPDQFATFLSGVFAPLAFLWLVLGFIQQGIELRHSADALWLQSEELKNSVEQQARLVEVSREQLEMEHLSREAAENETARISKPRLVLFGGGWSSSGGERKFPFTLQNLGVACTDVSITWDPGEKKYKKPVLKQDDHVAMELTYAINERLSACHVLVQFTDSRGHYGTQRFAVPIEQGQSGEVFGEPQPC